MRRRAAKPGSLGTDRHEAGHRSGSTLVDIRSPHVEGDGGDLETEADQDEGGADGEQERGIDPSETRRLIDDRNDPSQGGITRGTEDQGDAVNDETGGEGAQQEILDAGLLRLGARAGEGRQDIQAGWKAIQGTGKR